MLATTSTISHIERSRLGQKCLRKVDVDAHLIQAGSKTVTTTPAVETSTRNTAAHVDGFLQLAPVRRCFKNVPEKRRFPQWKQRRFVSALCCCNNECLCYSCTRMRIALYARVSTKDKRQDTENQLAQLREFARVQNWIVVDEYVDKATAKHSDREQFQKLFQDASQRKFDLVLFWSLDRFSREGVFETLNHLQRLSAAGVGYKSLTEQYLDSCGVFKDAVLSILATIAKQERIRLSERTLAGLAKARKEGRIGGRPRVVVDAALIEELAEEGASTREIGARFGVSAATVSRVLRGRRQQIPDPASIVL